VPDKELLGLGVPLAIGIALGSAFNIALGIVYGVPVGITAVGIVTGIGLVFAFEGAARWRKRRMLRSA
jgi:hypothetical protein